MFEFDIGKYLEILKNIDTGEAREVVSFIDDGGKVLEFVEWEYEEETSIGRMEDILQSRVDNLIDHESARLREMARRTREMLARKGRGEQILRNISLTLDNLASYEFWELEKGWIGWRTLDMDKADYDLIQELDNLV